MESKLRIGLVLEGGGAKGAFSFGFAEKCHELGIEFAMVSGTSVGGLNAWLVATGQLTEGGKLWRDLSFTQIYAPRVAPWQVVAVLFYLVHAYRHWLQGLPPFFDGASRFNHLLKALFRLITFIPLLIIYLALLRPPDLVSWIGLGVFTLYSLSPLVRLRSAAVKSDRGVGDRDLGGLSGQMLGLLSLTFLAALLLTVYRAITGNFGDGELAIVIYAATLAVIWVLASLANLADTPLAGIIDGFLDTEPTMPCFVTTAERVARYDPNDPNIVTRSISPTDPIEYSIAPATYFIPHYHELSARSRPVRKRLLRATAALPFGLVASVDFEGMTFIDGGMADNLPASPLLDRDLDVIVAVRLRPADEQLLPEAFLREELKRIARLSRLQSEAPDVEPSGSLGELQRNFSQAMGIIPDIHLNTPRLIVVSPKESLGGLLDFTDAEKKRALGAAEALRFAEMIAWPGLDNAVR